MGTVTCTYVYFWHFVSAKERSVNPRRRRKAKGRRRTNQRLDTNHANLFGRRYFGNAKHKFIPNALGVDKIICILP